MTNASDEIIILSDEDDDIKIVLPEQFNRVNTSHPVRTNSVSSSSSSSSSKHRAPVLVLTEPKSLSYGIERGYQLKHIHGLNRSNAKNDLMYLVEYERCDDYEFVPSTILHRYCDKDFLIQYLHKLAHFID